MAVASLVLGIISIVLAIFGAGYQWIGVLLGVAGIVLGVLGKKDPAQAGLAKAGMICSIIGTALSLLLFIACAACLMGTAGALNSALNSMY